MKVRRRFTILGCGSSPGVPRITGDWGACDPREPRNRRLRASFLVEQIAPEGGRTTVVIDTGPDFREQMIGARVKALDAVLYTHAHADHIHGIDDLRGFALATRRQIPIHASPMTLDRLKESFSYCFRTPLGSGYPPIVTPHLIEDTQSLLVIEGDGGPIPFQPIDQVHGDIHSFGFRIGDVAYCCDVSAFPEETLPKLQDLGLLIIDALQYRPHVSHLSLGEALDLIARLKPHRAVLTHMHTPLDYRTVQAQTPDHVEPAYDFMSIEEDIEI